jgi:hypothetical protein
MKTMIMKPRAGGSRVLVKEPNQFYKWYKDNSYWKVVKEMDSEKNA